MGKLLQLRPEKTSSELTEELADLAEELAEYKSSLAKSDRTRELEKKQEEERRSNNAQILRELKLGSKLK